MVVETLSVIDKGYVNYMDRITGIEKKIEETVIAIEITLDALFESQIQCKRKAKGSYPPKLDENISEFERDVYCIIRRWNLFKQNIRKMNQLKREDMVIALASMQRAADKKLSDIIFELRSIDEISEVLDEDTDIDDIWEDGQEWKEDFDGDGFTH